MRFCVITFLPFMLLMLPGLTVAADLIPCGNPGQAQCQWRDLLELVIRVTDYVVGLLTIIAVIIFIYAGLLIATAGANVEQVKKARTRILNTIIGFSMVLLCWVMVDTLIKFMITDDGNLPGGFGPWNEIPQVQVVTPTADRFTDPFEFQRVEFPVVVRRPSSIYNQVVMEPAVVRQVADQVVNNAPLNQQVSEVGAAAGVRPGLTNVFRAIIKVESNDCTNKVGQIVDGAGNRAYGCGQLLVATAKSLDPGWRSRLDETLVASVGEEAAYIALLRDNDEYNMSLALRYLESLYEGYGGDIESAVAAYNGGPRANERSLNCPGVRRWECEWDSDGCWDAENLENNGNTSCVPNEGYEETRKYVRNVLNLARELE